MAKKNVKYRLSDITIANLVKLLQLGILTGTDIADNFRLLELTPNGDLLDPHPEYLDTLEKNLQKMQDDVDTLSNSQLAGFKGHN